MSDCIAARLLAASVALVLIVPLSAPAQERGAGGAHPSIATQALSDAQKARLASAMARLDHVCAPLQMAREPLVASLRAMLERREESLKMQQQRLRERRGDAAKGQAGIAARGDGAGNGSAGDRARLADIDGALTAFARERTRIREDYQALIGALQDGDTPAADPAGARRSLTQALGSLGSRISRRIGPGTFRRIRRSAEALALSCYNAHLEQIGLVSADGERCRLQSLAGLRPQFLDSRCSYDPKQP